MKIAVIGPGAMGCLFTARFMKAGHKVYLIDYRDDRINRLVKSGIMLDVEGGSSQHVFPNVSNMIPNGMDLILVCTKAHATGGLRFPPETPVMTLQNGLGNVEKLCDFVGSARVLAGITLEAATHISEGHSQHCGSGLTTFGAWTTCPHDKPLTLFESAGFEVEITDAPGQVIWKKVAINSGINPLTALLNVNNGRLLEMNETRQLMRDLVVEAAKVASTEGYRFDESLIEITEKVCQETMTNISSMLQDIRLGRKTEIEAISGEILRRAQHAALPTPRTRVVYQLVRGLESL